MKPDWYEQDKLWEELHDGKAEYLYPRPVLYHNWVASNIAFLFENYTRARTDTALGFGCDLYLSEKDRFLPDAMVVCDRGKLKRQGVCGAPDLVVEVLSPYTAVQDRGYKMKAYSRSGVREYWIVDPASKTVEQYLLQDGELEIHASYTLLSPDEQEEDYTSTFRCSLYDDLEIHLEDIFSKMFES